MNAQLDVPYLSYVQPSYPTTSRIFSSIGRLYEYAHQVGWNIERCVC